MTPAELIAAIEALGWHRLTVTPGKVVGYHVDYPQGWQEWMEPAPGEAVVLTHFLTNIQNPELLARYA